MSNPPDQNETCDMELVACFRRGSQSAFDELVRRHSGKVYMVANGILGNKEDSEEVAQDVFMKVFNGIGQFREEASFSTWIHKIAVNLAKNKYNWRKRRGAESNVSVHSAGGVVDGEEVELQLPAAGLGPSGDIEGEELMEQITQAFEKLPLKFKEVLTLRHVEEFPYEKIADIVGCNLGTVKSRLARARESLRRMVLG